MIKKITLIASLFILIGCNSPTKSTPEDSGRLTWLQLKPYISSVTYTSSSSNNNTLYWTYSSSSYNSNYSSSN